MPAFDDPIYSVTSHPSEHCHGIAAHAAHLFTETTLLTVTNNVSLTKSDGSLADYPAGALCYDGHRGSLLLEGFESLSHSWLSCLTDHASPRLRQEFFSSVPLTCSFPQSSVLGLPLAVLLPEWSRAHTGSPPVPTVMAAALLPAAQTWEICFL